MCGKSACTVRRGEGSKPIGPSYLYIDLRPVGAGNGGIGWPECWPSSAHLACHHFAILCTWGELGGLLRSGRGWQSPDKFKAVRLLGCQPMDARITNEVAVILLAEHLIEPESRYAFQELRSEIPDDEFKKFKARVERREFEAITPLDATAARAVLLEIVEKATERLRKLEAKHQRVADHLESLQQDLLKQDRSKFGESYYRRWGSSDRLRHRSVDAIHKLRRNEEQGWGYVQSERERRKQEKRRELLSVA